MLSLAEYTRATDNRPLLPERNSGPARQSDANKTQLFYALVLLRASSA